MVVHSLSDGTIALDGGAMFGVVPRTLWQRGLKADDKHRVHLAMRSWLVVDGERRILVDDGAGDDWEALEADRFGLSLTAPRLEASLAAVGLGPDDITDVVLTHLHFDHAGGTGTTQAGLKTLRFPKATHWLQRAHWDWAHHPSDKDAGSFRRADLELLERSGKLELLDGPTELVPGFHLFLSDGHTRALQLVRLSDGGQNAFFVGDLIPTTAHLRPAWVAAYDLEPLKVIEEKKALLAKAFAQRAWLFFQHDPKVECCTVVGDGAGGAQLGEVSAW